MKMMIVTKIVFPFRIFLASPHALALALRLLHGLRTTTNFLSFPDFSLLFFIFPSFLCFLTLEGCFFMSIYFLRFPPDFHLCAHTFSFAPRFSASPFSDIFFFFGFSRFSSV